MFYNEGCSKEKQEFETLEAAVPVWVKKALAKAGKRKTKPRVTAD